MLALRRNDAGDRSRDPPPAAPEPNASDAKYTMTVAAQRVGSGTRRIALTVATPVAPGSYRLGLEMRDVGGRPLPAAERVAIPSVEVRVWGDRAVSYDVGPRPDGDGAVVQITNTGRTMIPAVLPRISSASRDLEAEVAHSFVTVTASSSNGADPAPLPLMTSPLVADLLPGATVSLDVTGIEAVTGRSTNWLTVNLIVLGDSTWLAPYSPAGAWLSDVPSGRRASGDERTGRSWLSPGTGIVAERGRVHAPHLKIAVRSGSGRGRHPPDAGRSRPGWMLLLASVRRRGSDWRTP